ncbi:toxin-antitoxin system YwqK family antitoxin [Zobellia nedashkovskayae]
MENGTLSEESHYVNGVLHGEQKYWYATGEISKVRNLVEGKEEGMQKAWLQNGKLYVNYEAKNGRIFGMKRVNSCYKLQDEVVIRDKKI